MSVAEKGDRGNEDREAQEHDMQRWFVMRLSCCLGSAILPSRIEKERSSAGGHNQIKVIPLLTCFSAIQGHPRHVLGEGNKT